jgi:hypothetical protein
VTGTQQAAGEWPLADERMAVEEEPGHDRPMATSRCRLAHCQRRDDLLGARQRLRQRAEPQGLGAIRTFWGKIARNRNATTCCCCCCCPATYRPFSSTTMKKTDNASRGQFESRASSARNLWKMSYTRQLWNRLEQLRLTQLHNCTQLGHRNQ